MAEILDNEEITAETLNEISTDLGYEELKFSAEEKFGNDKLNAITGDLVSKGILCKDNRCKCTLTDNRITVNTGVIVFENGSKKRITEAITLDVLEGGTNYIYAKNDTSNGKIYLTNSLTEPTGDYVPLCTVKNGILTDRRVFAKAKIDLLTEGNSYKKTFYPARITNLLIPADNVQMFFIKKNSGWTVLSASEAEQGIYSFYLYGSGGTLDRIEMYAKGKKDGFFEFSIIFGVDDDRDYYWNYSYDMYIFSGTESTN